MLRLPQIILLFPLSYAWDTTSPFPSCLKSEITWDQANIFDIVLNSNSAEECQITCADREACVSFTWLSEESTILPLSCGLFSKTGDELMCKNCVSGASECLCTNQGECVSQGDNMIQALPQTQSLRECKLLCDDNTECNEYTYYGDQHMLSHLCVLYSSCDTLAESLEDCTTGSKECEVCGFEDTKDGKCEKICESGWHKFEDHCYKLLDNSGEQYFDASVSVCTAECVQAGGQLASIHSQEENDFIYNSILRPPPSTHDDRITYIGAQYVDDFTYNWSDGTAWDFDNWAPGMPNRTHPCVFYFAAYNAPNKWTDAVCNAGHADCVCKK